MPNHSLLPLGVMTTEDIAKSANLSVGSVRVMASRARHRRDEGRALPTDIPEPDFIAFRFPLWRIKTVNKWIAVREKNHLSGKTFADATDDAAGKKKAVAKKAPVKKAAPAKKATKKAPVKRK